MRDGDSVKKNDLLLRFDTSLLRSEEAILASEYAELVARGEPLFYCQFETIFLTRSRAHSALRRPTS